MSLSIGSFHSARKVGKGVVDLFASHPYGYTISRLRLGRQAIQWLVERELPQHANVPVEIERGTEIVRRDEIRWCIYKTIKCAADGCNLESRDETVTLTRTGWTKLIDWLINNEIYVRE